MNRMGGIIHLGNTFFKQEQKKRRELKNSAKVSKGEENGAHMGEQRVCTYSILTDE